MEGALARVMYHLFTQQACEDQSNHTILRPSSLESAVRSRGYPSKSVTSTEGVKLTSVWGLHRGVEGPVGHRAVWRTSGLPQPAGQPLPVLLGNLT